MRTRAEITSADDKIIGTDFQYFYFIKCLLDIKKNESVGYEAKDDVHIEVNNGKLVLIQAKHTIKTNSQGQKINLTNMDKDFWKTLANWIEFICDKNEGREEIEKQIDITKNTKFILLTNKNNNNKNTVLPMIRNYQEGYSKIEVLIEKIKELETEDDDIKGYINTIIKKSKKILKHFFANIEVVFNNDTIIQDIKERIRAYMIREDRVDDVFDALFSKLKQEFFEKVNNREKQIISYDQWINRYRIVFDSFRTTVLPIRKYTSALPSNLNEQPFIKELIEIGDIAEDDLPTIAEFTATMLESSINIQKWYDDGEITKEEEIDFHQDAKLRWKNNHRKNHRATKRNGMLENDNALKCLDELRETVLKMQETELSMEFSNGEFYYLSNEGRIGWLLKWEDVYHE